MQSAGNAKVMPSIDSNRIKRSFFIPMLFSLFAAVLFLVGMQFDQWYIATTTGAVRGFSFHSRCTDSLCVTPLYNDVNLTTCIADGSKSQSRDRGVRWTLYVSIGGCFVCCLLLLGAATSVSKWWGMASIVVQFLTWAASLVSIALFAGTYESWYWCGKNFCDYLHSRFPTVPCFYMYTTGYVMVATGCCILFAGCVFSIVALMVRLTRETKLHAVSRRQGYAPPNDFEPPEGFYFDQQSGLYYSPELQLFLDPMSCHYYDPASGMWYDTSSQSWYELPGS